MSNNNRPPGHPNDPRSPPHPVQRPLHDPRRIDQESTRYLSPRPPNAGGGRGDNFQRGGRGPNLGAGMRPSSTYHQQQQNLAREVRQRKLQRQHQQFHQSRVPPPNNTDIHPRHDPGGRHPAGRPIQQLSHLNDNPRFPHQRPQNAAPPAAASNHNMPYRPTNQQQQFHSNPGSRPPARQGPNLDPHQHQRGAVGRGPSAHDSQRPNGYPPQQRNQPYRLPRPAQPLASVPVASSNNSVSANSRGSNSTAGGPSPRDPRLAAMRNNTAASATSNNNQEVVDLMSSDSEGESTAVPVQPPQKSQSAARAAAPKDQPPQGNSSVARMPPADNRQKNSFVDLLGDDDDSDDEQQQKSKGMAKAPSPREGASIRSGDQKVAAKSSNQSSAGKGSSQVQNAVKSNDSPAQQPKKASPDKTVIDLSSDDDSSSSDEDNEVDVGPSKATAGSTGQQQAKALSQTKFKSAASNSSSSSSSASASNPTGPAAKMTSKQTAGKGNQASDSMNFVAKNVSRQAGLSQPSQIRPKANAPEPEDSSDTDDDDGSSDSEIAFKATRRKTTKRLSNRKSSSSEEESESDSGNEGMMEEDDDEFSSSDEGGNSRFPKQMARKAAVMRAGGGMKTPARFSRPTPTMRGLGKAPTRRPKSRIYTSDSDDDSFSSSVIYSSDDSAAWRARERRRAERLRRLANDQTRFAGKTAAARKSSNSEGQHLSSQSSSSEEDGSGEATTSPLESADSEPEKLAYTTGLDQNAINKENRKRNQAEDIALMPPAKKRMSTQADAFSTPKPKRRKQNKEASEESEASVGAGNFALKVQSPAPLAKRRCREKAIDFREHLSPIESPYARAGDIDEQVEENLMKQVDFLTKIDINPDTGLPFMVMTCHAERAEILYDFRVDVAKSKIPNAGNGAFLTFLGARHLKASAYGRASQKMAQKPLALDDLTAVGIGGYGINVKITGPSIDEKEALQPLGIGPKRAYFESDYVPSPTAVFSSRGKGNGLIHLGRYGPFRPEDRKPIHLFDMKSYILGYEPSEWCFGVEEKLFDCYDQIIDITDDLTGQPHHLALKNIPMHVNEVGHDPNNVHNVQALTKHDRSVHYYIDIEEPLQKGDKVELLTDYFDTYEDIRERKGYGKRNLENNLQSDEDPGARFRRNDDLRGIIQDRMRALDAFDTYQMLEFVDEKIRKPLLSLIGNFFESFQYGRITTPVPSCQQFVALLRLRFIGEICLDHTTTLEKKVGVNATLLEKGYPWEAMTKECKVVARNMQAIPFPSLWYIDASVRDLQGNSILKALRAEVLEMTLRGMERTLQAAYDPGMWCPAALQLIDQISWDSYVQKVTGQFSAVSFQENLYRLAMVAARKVRDSAKTCELSALAFTSGIRQSEATVTAAQVSSLTASMFEGLSLNSKGLLAGALGMLAYFDCNFLLDDHLVPGEFTLPIECDAKFVMTKFEGFYRGSPLASLPKSTNKFEKLRSEINVLWYLVWQVAYVAHAFVRTELPSNLHASTLQRLCGIIGVDLTLVEAAIARGIRREKLTAQVQIKKLPFKKKTKKKATGSPDPRKKAVEVSSGPPDEPLEGGWPPGWTRKIYERQSGASQGHRDRYWFTPKNNYKLRSMSDVRKFIALMKTVGNEENAWKMFKGGKSA